MQLVIGVILMVANTVILAAVFGAFAFELGGTEDHAMAGVHVDQAEEVTATWVSEGNADHVLIDDGDADCHDDWDGETRVLAGVGDTDTEACDAEGTLVVIGVADEAHDVIVTHDLKDP